MAQIVINIFAKGSFPPLLLRSPEIYVNYGLQISKHANHFSEIANHSRYDSEGHCVVFNSIFGQRTLGCESFEGVGAQCML